MKYDPDGWEHKEPTNADYDVFRQWVIDNWGMEVWKAYAKGGWNE